MSKLAFGLCTLVIVYFRLVYQLSLARRGLNGASYANFRFEGENFLKGLEFSGDITKG